MNSTPRRWFSPPENLILNDDEAHLWRIDLRSELANLSDSLAVLSPDELRRAGKYHFEKDKNHFINARAALRQILSRYLDIVPNQIRFSPNQYGKPALHTENLDAPLEFNFSNSCEIAVCAVTSRCKIGVDVEFINAKWATAEVTERFFSSDEISGLREVSETLQVQTFFNIWTRKEAFIKAVGRGLSYAMRDFSVSHEPDETTPSLTIKGDSGNDWSLFSFAPHPEYAAALAVEGDLPTLRFWQFSARRSDRRAQSRIF